MSIMIGTKLTTTVPMNRQKYNDIRGWELPGDEDGTDEGYLVVDTNAKPNVEGFKGYVSWSPKEVFDNDYRYSGNLTFSDAIYMKTTDNMLVPWLAYQTHVLAKDWCTTE